MTRLTAILSALAALGLARPALATAPTNYQVIGPTPATYTPLVGGTDVTSQFSGDDGSMVTIPFPAGYNFRWFGNVVSEVYVDVNGFLSFGSSPFDLCSDSGCHYAQKLPLTSSSSYPVDSLYVWWSDIYLETSVGTAVSYGMESVNGTQVFTIDLSHMPRWLASSSNWSAKVHLYPGGSRIEVVYGTLSSPSGYGQGAVAGVQNSGTGTSALYAAGLPCATVGTYSSGLCQASAFPTNQSITYQWADKADLDWQSGQLQSVTASANPGDPVDVTAAGVVENTGTQDAGAFDAQLYFSATPSAQTPTDGGPAPVLLDTQTVADGVPMGQTAQVSFSGSFNRPAAGKYYLVLVADPSTGPNPDGGTAEGAVDEIDEGNNSFAIPLYVGTDLTGTIAAPDGGDVGQTVPVNVSVASQGIDAPTAPFDYNIYISASQTLDSSAVKVYTGTLNPADLPFNGTVDVPLPAAVPAQDFYFILEIDPVTASAPTGAIAEADETNNIVATSHTTHAQLPDLSISKVELLSTSTPNPAVDAAYFGQQALLRVTVTNLGPATAHDFDVALFFSGGLGAPQITAYDQLIGDPTVTELAGGATQVIDTLVTVPVDDGKATPTPWTAGDFYFGAVADSTFALGELNENNNLGKVGPVHVRAPAPDFTPIQLDAPSAAAAGEVIPVSRVIRNVGNRGNTGAGDSPCPYRYYLSSNAAITTEDIPLQILAQGQALDEGSVQLDVGDDSRATELLQLPGTIAPGTYYLGVLVNPDQSVDELDLTNDAVTAASQVVVANGAVSITTQRLPDGVVGVPYQVQLTASGGTDLAWSLSGDSVLPDGLSLSADGALTGTPTAASSGTLVVQVTSGDYTARTAYTLQVNDLGGPLEVLSQNLPAAVANQHYSQTLIAVGGVRPYAWSLVGGALPTGVTLDPATGTVAGIPNASGVPSAFAVMVTDAVGAAATAQVVMRVVGPSSLRIDTGSLPGGVVGSQYPAANQQNVDNTIRVSNAAPPVSFEVTSGALPPGLDLGSDVTSASVTGKPTTAGLYAFSVTATDASGQQDTRDYVIAVQPNAISLAALELPSVKPGDPYDADLSGITIRAAWSLYSGQLPPGITLDGSGHLSGTCDASATPGTYSFMAQAVDRNGRAGVVAESIVVEGTKRPIPAEGGCASASGPTMLLALLPLLGLLRRRRRTGMGSASAAAVLAAVVVALPGLAHAAYSKTVTTESYEPVSGGQTVVTGHVAASTLTLPFPFRFYGQPYTQVSVGTSGYLAFGGASANASVPSLSGSAPVAVAWGDNMEIPSGSSVTSVVNGSAPDREVVIQWSSAQDYEDYDPYYGDGTTFNFQIHLHESGVLEFSYGTADTVGTYGYSSTSAPTGIANGAGQSLKAIDACSGSCGYDDWPTNTRVTFVAGTDLSVTALTAPEVVNPGATVDVVATAANAGGQPVADASVKVVLSTDTQLGNADDVTVGQIDHLSLDPGATQAVTVPFSVGALTSGTYFLFAQIDPDGAVAEDDEGNNTFGPTRIDVEPPAPDLSPTDAVASTHAAGPGDAVTLSFVVHNLSATVASPASTYEVYLSTNAVVSQGDTLLTQGAIPPLDGGAQTSIDAAFTLPADVASGTYHLGVVVNPDLSLLETDPLNDTAVDPTALGVSSASLAVVSPADGVLPATSVGAVYSYTFAASGGDGTYRWSATSLPAGLALSAQGVLSGRPTQRTDSATPFTVTVADGAGHSADAQVTLQVSSSDAALAILTTALAGGQYAQAYVEHLVAVGGVAPYAWSLGEGGRLPGGVVLAADGTLEGRTREAGTFTFTATVTDSATPPHTASASLSLAISGASFNLQAATPSLPDATVGAPYQVVLGVSGGFGPYLWQLPYCSEAEPADCKPVVRFPSVATDSPTQSALLPKGLYFSCDFTGAALLTSSPPNIPPELDGGSPCYNRNLPADAPTTPQAVGVYAIPAQITDSVGQSIDVTFTLHVGGGQGLSITTQELPDALSGQAYPAVQLQASSPKTVGGVHWSLACSERTDVGEPVSPCPEGLPPGLALSDDGKLSGTPTDSSGKTYTFLVRAADDQQRVDVRAMSITARAPTPPAKASGCGSAPGSSGLLLLLAPLAALGFRRRPRSASARRLRLGLGLALMAALGLGSVGCGKKTPNTRCTGVTCQGGTACDPADGQCKCGGEGGVVCAASEVCDVETLACVDAATSCDGVTCTGNTACDPTDGQCKCGGAGGAVCGAGQVCDAQARVCTAGTACADAVCTGREVCDAASGQCTCDGQVCAAGQICAAQDGGGCEDSLCAGVHCIGGTTCDPQSGTCLCGGTSLCNAGQTCGCAPDAGASDPDGGAVCPAAARSCIGSRLCDAVTCGQSQTCDPADGQCKCGGPGGPTCGAGQSCDVSVGACIGGDRCRNITCATGTSCDPEDGQCKCGGQGGQVCGDADTCFQLQNGYACRTACDPLQQDCPPSQACYFDQSAVATTGYCASPGTKTDLGNPPPFCNTPNDCAQGYHCLPAGFDGQTTGTCQRYCSVAQGANGCTGTDICQQIPGAPTGLGACVQPG